MFLFVKFNTKIVIKVNFNSLGDLFFMRICDLTEILAWYFCFLTLFVLLVKKKRADNDWNSTVESPKKSGGKCDSWSCGAERIKNQYGITATRGGFGCHYGGGNCC